MPVTTRGLIDRIKSNEKNASYLKQTKQLDRILGNTDNGAYVGHGRREVVEPAYEAAGVTKDEAGKLYGREIVVGYGHMLTGKELKEYFNDPQKREYYNNLGEKEAEELLRQDIKKHQKGVEALLEEHKIKPESLSKEQKNALTEMHFQMGGATLRKFRKFWDYAKQGNWEEAAQELKYGRTRNDFSTLYRQAKSRTEQYMNDLARPKYEPSDFEASISGFPSTEAVPFNKEIPAQSGIPSDPADTPEFDNPEAENNYIMQELGIKPDDIEDESARYLHELGIAPEDVEQSTPQPQSPTPTIGQGEAAVRGAVHGATMGALQKASGFGNWLSEGMNRLWGEGGLEGAIKRSGTPEQTPSMPISEAFKSEDFQKGQMEYANEIENARKQWKKTMMASELLGGVATGALIGSPALKGASLAKKIHTAGKIGAAEGAITKGMESTADNMRDTAKDMAIGGLWGYGLGGGFGALAHGGGKLWKNIKGDLDATDAAKASILADDAFDPVLVGAEKRARSEAGFNNAMMNSIKSFTDEAKDNQMRFLKMKVKDAPKALKEWAAGMDAEALAKYSAEEPLNIPSRVLKVAKKSGVDPKLVHAFYNWRNDMFNYMKFINDIGGRASKSQADILASFEEVQKVSARKILDEIPTFKKNIKAGLVNRESYSEFKMQQYIAEGLQKAEDIKVAAAQIGYNTQDQRLLKAVEEEAREKLQNDPMRGWFTRNASTVSNAAEVIDDKAGTNTLDVVQNLYVADKLKSGFTRSVADNVKRVVKLRESGKYADITDEQIVEMIEDGVDDPLVNQFRKIFKDIREYANNNGMNIDEYRLGQDKYVPMKRKGAAELIESMRDVWDDIKKGPGVEKDELNRILNDRDFNPLLEEGGTYATERANHLTEAFRRNAKIKNKQGVGAGEALFGAVEEEAPKMPKYAEDLRHLQNLVGETLGREIRDVDMMERALRKLEDKDNIMALLSPALRNVHERNGTLPMWARELDIGKMAIMDADSIGDLIFKRPVLNKLDTQIMLLKMKGFHNSADYFNNLKKDILGITRKGTENRQIKSTLRELKWKKKPIGKLALGLENAVTSALYPNYLGFNARAIVRNLTQPYTMTTRELGVGLKGDILALNSTRKIMREGLEAAQKRFSKLGLIDERDPTSADFEGIKSGLRHYFKDNKIARRMDRLIDGYSDAAMTMYAKTDTINRLVTAQMSEDIAKMLKAGKTDWLKNAPKQIQNNIKNQLDAGASVDELTTTIGKWLQVKTQLNYAKDDMYQYGREMGPLFAMLSKWPSAVTSDIAAKIIKDGRAGATRAAAKYLGPLVFVNMLQNGLDEAVPSDSVQSREMFGYGGLNSWLPVNSVFGITDAALPIPAESLMESAKGTLEFTNDAMSGRWDREDTRKLNKVLQRTMETFVPVAGGVSKTKRHIENLSGKTDKDRKKAKRKRKGKYD